MKVKVLVVEDEDFTRRALCLALTHEGFEVEEAADAATCRTRLRDKTFEVVVLDLGLPDDDGVTLAGEIRRRGDLGVVVVTRRGEPETRIEALEIGADDYLVKPVHFGELAARIRSVMRRRGSTGDQRRVGRLVVDLAARSVVDGSTRISLTRGEFAILARLVTADGAVVGRADLLGTISRHPSDADLRSVDVLISRIRRKLGLAPDARSLIVSVPGVGYQLGVTVDARPS